MNKIYPIWCDCTSRSYNDYYIYNTHCKSKIHKSYHPKKKIDKISNNDIEIIRNYLSNLDLSLR